MRDDLPRPSVCRRRAMSGRIRSTRPSQSHPGRRPMSASSCLLRRWRSTDQRPNSRVLFTPPRPASSHPRPPLPVGRGRCWGKQAGMQIHERQVTLAKEPRGWLVDVERRSLCERDDEPKASCPCSGAGSCEDRRRSVNVDVGNQPRGWRDRRPAGREQCERRLRGRVLRVRGVDRCVKSSRSCLCHPWR